jgi:hypothetical protein
MMIEFTFYGVKLEFIDVRNHDPLERVAKNIEKGCRILNIDNKNINTYLFESKSLSQGNK